MYKITVPVMNSTVTKVGRKESLNEIKKFDADRVLLAFETLNEDKTIRDAEFSNLKINTEFFKSHGYEVGAWIVPLNSKNEDYQDMIKINGNPVKGLKCPSCEGFRSFAREYYKGLAASGVDMILIDDGFRYSILGDAPGCLCPWHMKEIERITGEAKTREELREYIVKGGKNKFRDAYLEANGNAMRLFASDMRKAVNEVNPNVRIGLCACMGQWDIDGIDASELVKIFAGDTKPFMRFIGAPYWAVNRNWGNQVQDAIDLTRVEKSWMKDSDIEVIAEGDVWPRPRTVCPASYAECFDMAVRASGCADGMLKYGMDYFSNTDYEQGYAAAYLRNKPVYEAIEKHFTDKKPVGVKVYEVAAKVADMVHPTKVNSGPDMTRDMEMIFFPKASRTFAFNAIPTVYEGEGMVTAVFDENARHIPLSEIGKGLIIDIAAAEILTGRGVDVGIEEIGKAESAGGGNHYYGTERFLENNNEIRADEATVYNLKLKDGAIVLSDTEVMEGRTPVSFFYENKAGQRFLVLNINTRSPRDTLLKHYERARQYQKAVKWISGESLPVEISGHPAVYMICKKGKDESLATGLCNLHADSIYDAEALLADDYNEIEFINCKGKLEGRKIYIEKIEAFSFAGFVLKK